VTVAQFAMKATGEPEDRAMWLLWNATSFPFDGLRPVFYQLRHVVRHRQRCADGSSMSGCGMSGRRCAHKVTRYPKAYSANREGE
jgi:hypothetical protein